MAPDVSRQRPERPGGRALTRRWARGGSGWWSAGPSIATPTVMSTTKGSLFLAAGVLALVPLLSPPAGGHTGVVAGIALVSIITGVGLLAVGRLIPRWTYHVLVTTGTVLITSCIVLSGGGTAAYAYSQLFLFAAVDCFIFFFWRAAAAQLALIVVCATVGLSHAGIPLLQILVEQGVIVAVAVTVARLVQATADADRDALTSLHNRRGFDRIATEVLAAAGRGPGPGPCLALMDVDHFKQVNDLGGHPAGDRLLRSLAQAWASNVRAGETLARYGGDEFAILLPHAYPEEAAATVERLRSLAPDGTSCSAGMAAWAPGDSLSMVLSRADAALYESKRLGRGRTSVHHPTYTAVDQLEREIADSF